MKRIIKWHCDGSKSEIKIYFLKRRIDVTDWQPYDSKTWIGKTKSIKFGILSFIKTLNMLLIQKRISEFLFWNLWRG